MWMIRHTAVAVLVVALVAVPFGDILRAESGTSGMSIRLELFVSDLTKSTSFYQDVLGFDLERRTTGYAVL